MGYPCYLQASKDCNACGECKNRNQEDVIVCENCEEKIYDHYYDIHGEILCDECMEKLYGKYVW